MKSQKIKSLLSGFLLTGFIATAEAAPILFEYTATIIDVSGSYAGSQTIGDTLLGSTVFDTDEANASSAETTPGTVPGHEYSSGIGNLNAIFGQLETYRRGCGTSIPPVSGNSEHRENE